MGPLAWIHGSPWDPWHAWWWLTLVAAYTGILGDLLVSIHGFATWCRYMVSTDVCAAKSRHTPASSSPVLCAPITVRRRCSERVRVAQCAAHAAVHVLHALVHVQCRGGIPVPALTVSAMCRRVHATGAHCVGDEACVPRTSSRTTATSSTTRTYELSGLSLANPLLPQKQDAAPVPAVC